MSWINRNIRTTNRVFRALRGGKVNLSARTLADATAELCANYRSLMIDNSFRTDIIEASQAQSVLAQSGNYTAELENELPWGAGVGLTLEAFKATIGAIGSTMFQHYTSPDR